MYIAFWKGYLFDKENVWVGKFFLLFYLPEEVKRILLIISLVIRLLPLQRDRGLEQLISNGGRFKPAFA